VRIGTIAFSKPAKESIRLGILAEKLGYDSFWVTDHLVDLSKGTTIDPWTTIAALSVQTKKLIMGSSVTDTQRAHPAKTAQIIATLNEISGGRVILGIGAGEAMNLVPFGIPFDDAENRVGRLSEAVQVIKALWSAKRDRPVSFRGKFYNLKNAWLDQEIARRPRLYVGVFGSRKGLEVVGSHADGWLPWINTPETYRDRLRVIKEAAKTAGRSLRSLEFVAPMYATMTKDAKKLKRILDIVKQALLIERNTLKKLGFSPPSIMGTTYQTVLVRNKVNQNLEKFKDAVPDEIAERFLAHGSPSAISERIDELNEAGATHLIVQFLDSMESEMVEFSKTVFPLIERRRNS
jgi:phthiodiolone/phenolphthiodiolone dimycocerosates ketoreductase